MRRQQEPLLEADMRRALGVEAESIGEKTGIPARGYGIGSGMGCHDVYRWWRDSGGVEDSGCVWVCFGCFGAPGPLCGLAREGGSRGLQRGAEDGTRQDLVEDEL